MPATPSDEWIPAPVTGVPGRHAFRDGQKVRHAMFGEGHVVSSKLTRDDEEVTVAFPDQGVKKLMVGMAKLEVLA
jgi:DNA helicase-2/ATP-dependent DNA helicase PcrA